MRRIKFLFIFSFSFLITFLPVIILNNANENTNLKDKSNKISLAVSDYIDNGKPQANNEEKLYESNIPDEWYDSTKYYGFNYNNDDGSSPAMFLDFISSDRTVNYFTDEDCPIIELKVGDTKDFYLEIAHLNWSSYYKPYDNFFVYAASDKYELNISQDYVESDVKNTYQHYNNSIDGYSYTRDTSTGPDSKLDYNYDTSQPELNENYYMPKFSFTAIESGYSMVTIGLDSIASGGPSVVQFEFLLHTYDEDSYIDTYNSYKDLVLTNYANLDGDFIDVPFNLDLFKTNNLPIYVEDRSYIFDTNFSFTSNIINYDITLFSVDDDVIISNNEVKFKNTGFYKIYVLVKVSLQYDTYSDSSNFISLTKEFEIVDYFNVNAYSVDSLRFENTIIDNEANVIYAQNQESISLEQPGFDYISFSYSLNGNNVNDYLTDLYPGEYSFEISLYDNLKNNSLTKNYILIVKNEDIFQGLSFDCGSTLNLILGDFDRTNPGLALITNYYYVKKYADISYTIVSGDCSLLHTDEYLYINSANYGKNVIEFNVSYKTKQVKSYLVINVINEYIYTLNASDVKMGTNSFQSLNIGYLADSTFNNISSEEFLFTINNNSPLAEFVINDNVISISSNDNLGSSVIGVAILYRKTLEVISILSFTLTVGETDAINSTINFVEGDIIRILLSDKSKTITLTLDPVINDKNYNFSWLSFNTKICNVMKTTKNTALVTGIGVGTTEVVAISQNDDGSTITAKCKIIVFNDIPNISIDLKKESNELSQFTIFDLINVSLNNNNFRFSSDVEISWYLNDELISTALDDEGNNINLNNSYEFFYKFNEGISTLKVVLIDNLYNLTLESIKDISITSIKDKERILSFDNEEIYLDLNGDMYLLRAYLDGVENTDYSYSWSVDDNKVVSIFMSENNTALLKPISIGETIINVFSNIGKYEENILRSQIVIKVEGITEIKLSPVNNFNKPGDNVEVILLLNGKSDFVNYNPNITIKDSNDLDVQYDYSGGKIVINNAPKSKLYLTASLYDLSDKLTLNITNFNIAQIMLQSAPYLSVGLVCASGGFVVFKLKSNPFVNSVKSMNKLANSFDKAINATKDAQASLNEIKKKFKKINKKINKLNNQLMYYIDEGIDEFTHVCAKLKNLIQIFKAILKNSDNEQSLSSKVLENIKEKFVDNIKEMIEEVVESRKKYQEAINKVNSKEIDIDKKIKKNKMTKKEYQNYLEELGISNYENQDENFD